MTTTSAVESFWRASDRNVDGLRQARMAAAERAGDRRVQQIPDGGAPDPSDGRRAARAGAGERVEEEVCHFLAVAQP
jgi:hypothetical protein